MRVLASERPACAASSSAIAASTSTRSGARAVHGRAPNNLSRSRDTAPASFPRVCARRSSSSARVSTSTGRSAASSCPSTCRASASSRPAACCSSSFKPSRTTSTFSFGRVSSSSACCASSTRCSTCRIRLRAVSFHASRSTWRRASATARMRRTASPAVRSNPRRASSHLATSPSSGMFPAGSSATCSRNRRNADGDGVIFMPAKSSRPRGSPTFRRCLWMVQQVLADRARSARPPSPGRRSRPAVPA